MVLFIVHAIHCFKMVGPEAKEGTLGSHFYVSDPGTPVTMAQLRGTMVPQRQVLRHTGSVRPSPSLAFAVRSQASHSASCGLRFCTYEVRTIRTLLTRLWELRE